MRTTLLGLAAVLALSLTACSSDDSDESADGDSSAGSSAADLQSGVPDCADVWVDGGSLPEDYEGCRDGDTIVASFTWDCEDGRTFTSSMPGYGFLGGELWITPDGLDEPDVESAEYTAAFWDDCMGGVG